MIAYNQSKYTDQIEQSPYTLASDGCFICSLASIHTRFYPDAKMDPVKMMTLLEPIIGNKTGAIVIGNLTGKLAEKVGFEYSKRVYKDIPADYSEHANNPKQAVIIEVDVNRFNNIKTDQHFVAVSSCAEGLEIMDPLGGKFRRGLPPQYLFKSYIVFNKLEKKQIPSDWAASATVQAKQKGVMKDDKRPHDEMTAVEMTQAFANLKWIEKAKDKGLTRQEFAVMLDKNGFLEL